jgi:hypothetical protein
LGHHTKIITVIKVNPGSFIFVKSRLGTEILHICGISFAYHLIPKNPLYLLITNNAIFFHRCSAPPKDINAREKQYCLMSRQTIQIIQIIQTISFSHVQRGRNHLTICLDYKTDVESSGIWCIGEFYSISGNYEQTHCPSKPKYLSIY